MLDLRDVCDPDGSALLFLKPWAIPERNLVFATDGALIVARKNDSTAFEIVRKENLQKVLAVLDAPLTGAVKRVHMRALRRWSGPPAISRSCELCETPRRIDQCWFGSHLVNRNALAIVSRLMFDEIADVSFGTEHSPTLIDNTGWRVALMGLRPNVEDPEGELLFPKFDLWLT